jgi:SAM-dependent methyltransferase
MIDGSNGYERVAKEFLDHRSSCRSIGIGVTAVRAWAQALPRGAAVIDIGCGPGFPITELLVAEGLSVFAVDAAPSFVEAFRRNLPSTPVVCEAVQDSTFFDRCGPRMGSLFPAFSRRPATVDPTNIRDSGARWPTVIHGKRDTGDLERCDDRVGVTLSWSRGVPKAAVRSRSLGH